LESLLYAGVMPCAGRS
jgi:Winged helix-turn helix